MVRGWEDGGGLGWACLYTASTHPARHGLMVPLQLRRSASRCLAFLYANDCKLTLSVQRSARPLNALNKLILSVKVAQFLLFLYYSEWPKVL